MARAYGVLRGVLLGSSAARHTVYVGVDGRVLLVDTAVRAATAGEDVAEHLGRLGVPGRT